jgi:hypothetical protein
MRNTILACSATFDTRRRRDVPDAASLLSI